MQHQKDILKENGLVVTNTENQSKTSISGEKVWDDKDNQDGKRPEKSV